MLLAGWVEKRSCRRPRGSSTEPDEQRSPVRRQTWKYTIRRERVELHPSPCLGDRLSNLSNPYDGQCERSGIKLQLTRLDERNSCVTHGGYYQFITSRSSLRVLLPAGAS